MSYGELKIDTITFTAGGVDSSISVSGLVQNPTFTGNLTTTGTISGDVVKGNTVSGATVTGGAGEFGTITGNTAGFTTVTGTTVTGTTANFVTLSGTTVTGNTGQFTNITGVNIVGTTEISGATVTGDVGRFTTITGGTHTLTSGVFASGTAANPSITFIDDLDTGLFTGEANTVSLVASGAAVLTVSGTNVGVGTASPSAKFDVKVASDAKLLVQDGNTTNNVKFNAVNNAVSANVNLEIAASNTQFFNGGSEKARIDSSGRLLVGTTSDTNAQFVVTAGAQVTGAAADANADRTTLDYSSGVARLMGHNSSGGEIRFFTNASGGGVTERMTIGSTGHVLINNDLYVDEVFTATTSNSTALILGARNAVGTESETCRAVVNAGLLVGRTSQNFNNAGTVLWSTQGGAGASGAVYHERDSASTTVMWLHHMQSSATGIFADFHRGNSSIGSINFNGTTVSYNPFLGSHWAALTDRSKPNLLPGTILETVNQLMEWKLAVFTVNGETKKMAWNGTENVGDNVTVTYEGSDYTATIQLEDDAEELNKHVCVKVNDTAGSSAVFGVFLGWDDTNADGTDKASPIIGAWNDMNVAAVGNYFIRIASGQTVAIGDLIEADGSGCGVVQSDDIIRSKTVAKVTSTTAQETYDDGSFLVTCVLCCG